MSCNYADGLSPYENKGILGLPENFEPADKLKEKCDLLANMIAEAKHVVVHTGAGISTSAGIPDFRGPNGVWTLERDGRKPNINVSFAEAKPTKTHMALKELVQAKKVQYIVSQNIDGLHLKSGVSRDYLAELHGNMFVDQCNTCKRQFARTSPVSTVGQRTVGDVCKAGRISGRPCRGRLHDIVLDWEHNLPEDDLLMAEMHSCMADLSICLGTTLQIVPSGNLPLNTLKYGGKLVICNLQTTKHDNKTDLTINYYVDEILSHVMKTLNLEIPDYADNDDPTSNVNCNKLLEWTIHKDVIKETQALYKTKCKGVPKNRQLVKRKRDLANERHNGIKDCIKKENTEIKVEKYEIKTESNEVKLEEISNCEKKSRVKEEVT